MASSFRTQKQHGRGDDAHWVVTLSGLISGPYYGRFFSALVPETVLSSAQGCDVGLYTLGIDFKVEDIFRSFAFVVIRSDEALLVLESDAALGDHDAGQASVGTQWVCKSSWGFCVGSRCVGGRPLLDGVAWAGERCRDVRVLIFAVCCDQTLV